MPHGRQRAMGRHAELLCGRVHTATAHWALLPLKTNGDSPCSKCRVPATSIAVLSLGLDTCALTGMCQAANSAAHDHAAPTYEPSSPTDVELCAYTHAYTFEPSPKSIESSLLQAGSCASSVTWPSTCRYFR